MYTNTDITLYSWQTGDKYIRSVIKNVFWQEVKQSNIEKTGLISSDSVKIFIPGSSLPIGGLKFTTSKDMVVKGDISTEIDNTSASTISNSIKALRSSNEVYSISAADCKLYGSQSMQHYQLSCK